MKKYPMLTTTDNPYSPFTQFEQWLQFDITHGYNSCGLLDRFAHTSDRFTDEMNYEIISNAISEIVNDNYSGMHVAVYPEDKKKI